MQNVTVIIPPNILCLMTGVVMAKSWGNGKVELTYTDHTTETAVIETPIPQDWFQLVGSVQSHRKDTK